MKAVTPLLITTVILALFASTEGWLFTSELQKLGNRIEKVATKTLDGLKKAGCKVFYLI